MAMEPGTKPGPEQAHEWPLVIVTKPDHVFFDKEPASLRLRSRPGTEKEAEVLQATQGAVSGSGSVVAGN